MKDVQILQKKKQGLLSRLFGIRSQAEKEEAARTHREEIESLQTEIKTVDDEIFDSVISEAREKVDELAQEAIKLVEEKTGLQKRTEEIDVRLIEIFTACSAIIPKKRRQTSSKRTVKMFREVEEREFIGLFRSNELAYEGGVPVGYVIKPSIDVRKKIVEIDVPAFPGQIQHAQSLGYELKTGEKVEDEILTDENSIMTPCFPMPDVLAG